MFSEASATLEAPKQPRGVLEPAPRFEMPIPMIGSTVIWRSDPRMEDGTPGLVTRVGTDAIAISVFVDGAQLIKPVDGTRYRTDPRWTPQNGLDSGVWSFLGDGDTIVKDMGLITKTVEDFSKVIADLSHRVKSMEAAIQAMTPPAAAPMPAEAKKK